MKPAALYRKLSEIIARPAPVYFDTTDARRKEDEGMAVVARRAG